MVRDEVERGGRYTGEEERKRRKGGARHGGIQGRTGRGREKRRIIFFSSRRRHTRYWRDWSSDVCSSDLLGWGGSPVVCDPPSGASREEVTWMEHPNSRMSATVLLNSCILLQKGVSRLH